MKHQIHTVTEFFYSSESCLFGFIILPIYRHKLGD